MLHNIYSVLQVQHSFHKLFHYGHPVVFPVGSPEGCPVESPDGSLCFGSVFFSKPINLEMTKASVCQTTQSAPFLPSYSIPLPHTYTQRTHTQTHTHTCTHNAFSVGAHLPVGPPASALYLSKTLVAWAVYVQGPPHL